MFNMDDRARYSPVAGAQPFFTYWDIGTIANNVDTTADDQVAPIAYQFWNDWRNVLADPGPDGIPGNADDTPVMEDASGSPLDTRLPIAVTTDFMLFFRSPYVGAPDFNERFTQRIDLPTAARRTFKAAAVP
jgi:hypothetical protein